MNESLYELICVLCVCVARLALYYFSDERKSNYLQKYALA